MPKQSLTKKKVVQGHTCQASVLPEEAFWVNNGPIVHNRDDMLEALKTMSDDQFAYHTKREGNDIAKWVEECLGCKSCASAMRRSRTRAGMQKALASYC